jgi:hypothetical protein
MSPTDLEATQGFADERPLSVDEMLALTKLPEVLGREPLGPTENKDRSGAWDVRRRSMSDNCEFMPSGHSIPY